MRYRPKGSVEAHRTDDGQDYLLVAENNGFMGVLDAHLFDRVFTPEQDEPTREVMGMIGDRALRGDPDISGHFGTSAMEEESLSAEGRDRARVIGKALDRLAPEPAAPAPRRAFRVDRFDSEPTDEVPLREAMRAPTVAAGIRAVVDAGVPLKPEDLVPAAERMQQSIAARTVPGGPGAPPRVDVERAIEETRAQIKQEGEDRVGRPPIEGGTRPAPKYGLMMPGEKPGKGKRVCSKCHWSNSVNFKKCVNVACGKKL